MKLASGLTRLRVELTRGLGLRSMACMPALLAIFAGCTTDEGPVVPQPPQVDDPCKMAVCDPVSGACAITFAPDGTRCDDGDMCTGGDTCRAGTCIRSVVDCDDANPCTDDTCDPTEGCINVANSAVCDDENACTSSDQCSEGACVGTAITCDDGNLCTTDSCDPAVGCTAAPEPGLEAPCGGLGGQCPVGLVCIDDSYCKSCDGLEHFVPQGRFWMGCDSTRGQRCPATEQPFHRVVTTAFSILPNEVTAAEYAACVDAGGCTPITLDEPAYATYGIEGRESHPVAGATWYQARDFCAWMAESTDAPWRLCTESEWEKAARGSCELHCGRDDADACCRPAMPRFPWGDAPATCALAVMNDPSAGGNGCGTGISAPVATRPNGVSPFGLHDMAGNLWEWVEDCWAADHTDAPIDGSAFTPAVCQGDLRVIRGGSFGLGADGLTTSSRTYHSASDAYAFYGFRCCRTRN